MTFHIFSSSFFVPLFIVLIVSVTVEANSDHAYSHPKKEQLSVLAELKKRFVRVPNFDFISHIIVRKQSSGDKRRHRQSPLPSSRDVGPRPRKSRSPPFDSEDLLSDLDTVTSIEPEDDLQPSAEDVENDVQDGGDFPFPSSFTPTVAISASTIPAFMSPLPSLAPFSPDPKQTRSRRRPRRSRPARSPKPSVSLLPTRSPRHRRKKPSRSPTKTPTPLSSFSVEVEYSVFYSVPVSPSALPQNPNFVPPSGSISLSPSSSPAISSSSSSGTQAVSATLTPSTSIHISVPSSPSSTFSVTPTMSSSSSISETPSASFSFTQTMTPTSTSSISPSLADSPTTSVTVTLTVTPSVSATASISFSGSETTSFPLIPSGTTVLKVPSPSLSITVPSTPDFGPSQSFPTPEIAQSTTSASSSSLPSYPPLLSATQEFSVSPSILPIASETASTYASIFSSLAPSESDYLTISESPPVPDLPTLSALPSAEGTEFPSSEGSFSPSKEPISSFEGESQWSPSTSFEASPTNDALNTAEISPSSSFAFVGASPSTDYTQAMSFTPDSSESSDPSVDPTESPDYNDDLYDESDAPSQEPTLPSLYPMPSSGGNQLADPNDPSISPKAGSSLNPAQQEVTPGPLPSAGVSGFPSNPPVATQSPLSSNPVVIIPPPDTSVSPPGTSIVPPTPGESTLSPSIQPIGSSSASPIISFPPVSNGPVVSPVTSSPVIPPGSAIPSTVTDGDTIIVPTSYSPTGEANETEPPINQPELVDTPDTNVIQNEDGSSNSTLSDEEGDPPSVITGEWRDKMGTGPAGRAFPIIMGILGSLLVLALIICLVMSVLGAPPASYSYNSQPTGQGPPPNGYGSVQSGQYTDQGGMSEGGVNYGAENFSEGYAPNSFGYAPQGGGISPGPGTYSPQYTGASPIAPAVNYEGNLEAPDGTIPAGDSDPTAAGISVRGMDSSGTGSGNGEERLVGDSALERGVEDTYPYPHPYGQPYVSAIDRESQVPPLDSTGYGEYTGATDLPDELDHMQNENLCTGSPPVIASGTIGNRDVRPGRSVQFADEAMDQRLSTLASGVYGAGGTVGLVDRGDYYYTIDDQATDELAPPEDDMTDEPTYDSSDDNHENGDVRPFLPVEENDATRRETFGDRESDEAPPLGSGSYSENSDTNQGGQSIEEDAHDNIEGPLANEQYRWWEQRDNVGQGGSDIDASDEMKENSIPLSNVDNRSSAHGHALRNLKPGLAVSAENEDGKPTVFGERLVLGDSDWQRISQRENTNDCRRIPDPEYDYLRKLREPYVKSVAGRLSTRALSCTTAANPMENLPENGDPSRAN